ncbi:MAG: DNA-protecting protein DprA [Actinobacteria bacterium]|nr:DNA-protecting protein DprA [Actinomycetota bacterium]
MESERVVAGETDRLALLALCTIKGANWSVLAREAQRPRGLERLLAGSVGEDSRDGRATASALADVVGSLEQRQEDVAGKVATATAVGARLVTVLDDDYPANLRLIAKLPPFLFVRGELRRDDARSVAVVGTRGASEEGLDRARDLAGALVAEGVTVISGLARGVDTAAHTATLAAGGRTIAVIGTGILRTYPAENGPLAERILEGGAIVSQFWPDAPPARYTFPMRNEVMSGISQGTAVIEAGRTSGAKMQARLALEQGKRAFLMSSLVTSESWARDYMDRRGAIEVTSVADVVGRLRSAAQVEQQSSQRHQLALEHV